MRQFANIAHSSYHSWRASSSKKPLILSTSAAITIHDVPSTTTLMWTQRRKLSQSREVRTMSSPVEIRELGLFQCLFAPITLLPGRDPFKYPTQCKRNISVIAGYSKIFVTSRSGAADSCHFVSSRSLPLYSVKT